MLVRCVLSGQPAADKSWTTQGQMSVSWVFWMLASDFFTPPEWHLQVFRRCSCTSPGAKDFQQMLEGTIPRNFGIWNWQDRIAHVDDVKKPNVCRKCNVLCIGKNLKELEVHEKFKPEFMDFMVQRMRGSNTTYLVPWLVVWISMHCNINPSNTRGETGLNQRHGELSRAHSPHGFSLVVWLLRFGQHPWNTKVVSNNQKKGCIQVCRFNLGLWQEEGNIFCLAKLVSQTNVSTIFSVFPNVTMQLWKAAASQKTMAGNILSTTSFFQNESTDWQCSPQRPFLQHWQLIRHHWPVKGFPERDTMRKTKQVIQTKHVPVPVLLSHAKNSRLTIHNLCKSAIHLDSVYLGVWPSNFNVYCPIKYTPSGSQWIVRFALCQNSLRCCYCWLVNLRHPTSLELLSTNNTSGNNQSPTQASVA